MKSNKSKISCKRGFTLIELLVVVLIVGILAAVAVPRYQAAVYKTRLVSMIPLVQSITAANELYYLDNGTYTTSLSKLDIDLPTNIEKRGNFYYLNGFKLVLTGISTEIYFDDANLLAGYAFVYQHMTAKANNTETSAAGKQGCAVYYGDGRSNMANKICSSLTGRKMIGRGAWDIDPYDFRAPSNSWGVWQIK